MGMEQPLCILPPAAEVALELYEGKAEVHGMVRQPEVGHTLRGCVIRSALGKKKKKPKRSKIQRGLNQSIHIGQGGEVETDSDSPKSVTLAALSQSCDKLNYMKRINGKLICFVTC